MARTAGDVLTTTIRAQVDAILGAQDAVRRDAPDAVHRVRVAVRRLRALLRSHPRCLASDTAGLDTLAADLADHGRVLGDARDPEVQRARLAELARDLIPAGRAGHQAQVRDGFVALDDALSRRHAVARRRLVAVLDSAKHADLLRRLRALADAPPLAPRAERPARRTLRPGLDRDLRRVRRRAARVTGGPDDVHRLRKAVRRARYTADVLASFGDGSGARRARRSAARLSRLQDALGTVHDADTLRAALIHLRDPATTAAVDVCLTAEERRAHEALARSRDLLPPP